MRLSYLFLSLGLVIQACHSGKKSLATNDKKQAEIRAKAIQDSITAAINAEIQKSEQDKPDKTKPAVYRASNTRSTDILHTRLDVNFDWTNSRMNGIATIYARPYFYPGSMMYLNARGMDIKKLDVFEVLEVTKSKTEKAEVLNPVAAAVYRYENDSLKINLGKTFTADKKYMVKIEYVSRPNELKNAKGSAAITDDKGLYFINPTGENPYKMPQIWTQGETQSNSVWMPTIDSPNEKMTQEIYMTVEDKFTTLSNGLLTDSKKNPDGTRTDHWKLDQPHSPYLAMMAVGEFKKVVDAPWNGKEISYYVEKEYESSATGIFGDTREMIEFYSSRLGVAYPWPKYAQIAVRDYVSGAMENTSATLHGDFVVYQTSRELIDGKKGEDVIAHELFHQWFGDIATCESWSNLSLNESFATYGEYLWNEYKFGRDAADHHHAQSRAGYIGSQKEANLIRFEYEDKEDMFDGISYNKGGQILHMLRKAVGDDAFFASLKNYLETNRYKSAEAHNLRLAFEEVTGRDMNWFFNQWYFNKGRPKLKVSQTYNASTAMVELTVEQNQDLNKAPLYTLPLDVDVYVGGKAGRTNILITEQKQTFKIKTAGQPQLVNFDAERQLLCDLEYKKTNSEYIFQYRNAPLYDDRMEALKALEENISQAEVFDLFKLAAQNDKFHAVRNFAMQRLDKGPADKMNEVKNTLLAIYNSDKKTTTRAKALALLNRKFKNDPDVNALNESALKETSYAICGEALEALAVSDPKKAYEKAKLFENETGKDVLFPVANIYATQGGDNEIPFFRTAIRYMGGFEMMGFVSSYVKLARRCNSANGIAAAMDLEGLSKGANKFMKFGIIKGIKDLMNTWEGKENALKAKLEAAKKENASTADIEKELQQASETKEIITKIYNRCK